MVTDINKKLAGEFRNTFDGSTWYSSNFMTVIESVDADMAVKKLKGFPNSIVEIVCHMTQWKKFSLKKLEGDTAFDIFLNSREDWQRFNSLSEEEWEEIKSGFEHVTLGLANAIAALPDHRLDDVVPGRSYSYLHLIIGVTEHELVHTTQISYLSRLLDT